MKNLILTFAIVLTSLFSFSQDAGITITITVDNVKNDNGKVMMALHTSDTFMKGKGVMNAISEIKDGKVILIFEDVKPGTYAILGLHDENENGRIDFSDNGMPLESYGMSNNVMLMGPPSYDDAKFMVEDKDLEMNIRF